MPVAGPYEHLELRRDDDVAVVTVTRPKALNALNDATLDDLARAFALLADDGSVKAVVVTGAGEKAFVAGADITELAAMSPTDARTASAKGQAVFSSIERCGKPVVAAVNGFALGGGLELALACHIRFAADTARIGLPEVTLGLIPGYGGTQRLARLCGVGRALELVLSGDMLDAAAAERAGIVNRVVPAAELLDACMQFARKLASRGPLALRYALDAVLGGAGGTLEAGLAMERDLFALCFATADMREGTTAFLGKRKAVFEGR
jgi:enoyl-CoA hydratase